MTHEERVERLQGKTAFVIGTGPSLRDIDVSLLKNYTTITFNRAYVAFEEWGFDPTYYLAIDGNDMRSMYKDINNLIINSSIKNFFFSDVVNNEKYTLKDSYQDGDIVSSKDMFVDSEKVFYLWPDRKSMMNPEDSLEARKNTTNRSRYFPVSVTQDDMANAGMSGMRVLVEIGYTNIAFVGCDCRYKDDGESNKDITIHNGEYASHANTDINHFREDYFGKGIHFGKPNEECILHIWKQSAEWFKKRGVQVTSCTENSKANEWYDYVPFKEYIKSI